MKITLNPDKEIVKTIQEGLKMKACTVCKMLSTKGGYCPCRLSRAPEYKCMCEEFKAQIADPNFEGYCHCKLYYKHK